LTALAVVVLDTLVQNADVFEFGSGGSTLWLAERVASLISVEDNAEWFALVTAELAPFPHAPVELRHVPTAQLPEAIVTAGQFDVVFVDCMTQPERYRAVLLGAEHVRPGGWLVADDYDFPKVRAAVDTLRARGWAVTVVSGAKVHPVRHVRVETATAFCHFTGTAVA
jgi:predicted O-methyltransferase YrrM